MKVLFIGDISARPGRETVRDVLPDIRKENEIDFVIANCENSARGYGVTLKILNELQSYGVDFFTSGDHVWTQKEFVIDLEDKSLPLIRPYNYEKQNLLPGKGYEIIQLKNERLIIINLLGQVFMKEQVRNPFWVMDELLAKLSKEENLSDSDAIIIDFHAEATSEKLSLAYYLQNKITALLGTHTHVATADFRLIGNTAFVSDVGMVGAYDASLWASFSDVIHNFKYPFKYPKTVEFEGRRVFNSVMIEIESGVAKNIVRKDRIINK